MKIILLFIILNITSFSISSKNIDKLIKKHGLNSQNLGLSIIDIESNKSLIQNNSNKLFPPASVAKILTAEFALNKLGPDYRFTTEIWIDGKLKDGILQGDLYLVGTGDPMLFTNDFLNIIFEIKKLGVKKVTGNFYITTSNFPVLKKISDLGLPDQAYNPGLSGLSFEFNRHKLLFDKKTVTVVPPIDNFNIRWVNTKFEPGIKFNWKSSQNLQLSNSVRYRSKEIIPIKDPELYAALMFKRIASFHGLDLSNPQKSFTLRGKAIYIHKGRPVSELVKLMMEYSNNLIAESLLIKSATKDQSSKILSLKEAAKKLLNNIPNIKNNVQIYNGSGLSYQTKMSPQFLSSYLKDHYHKKYGELNFPVLFSASGINGWMTKRFNKNDNPMRIWAKTGSLFYVSALAGYIYSKSGKTLAFSFFYWDPKKRTFLNTGNSKLHQQLRKAAPKWKNQYNPKIDAFISEVLENI